MYAVILAGGGGTRLWPLSRPDRPKPFLPLLGEETLFQRTVSRIRPLVGDGNVYCVAERRYAGLVQQQAPDVRLLVEPSGKNTAAAIALGAVAIERRDDEVMLVLPADHWIANEDGFRAVLDAAQRELTAEAFGVESPLVTLGVRPDRPATEYGYLIPDTLAGQGPSFGTDDTLDAFPLRRFEEKPAMLRAIELVNEPGVAWNAGIFLWQRAAIRAALEKFTPLPPLLETSFRSDIALTEAYDRISPLSIDKAVMEGAAQDGCVVMGAMDVGWSDLGSWTALLHALAGPDEANGTTGRVLQPGEVVETGPDDLVVRTRGGALVCEQPAEGLLVADSVCAHLSHARPLEPRVRGLLERVQGEGSRS
ncbi:MAG: sugar phosphate nucleotidyltransferase [Chloroflexota bacterium]